MEIVTHKDHPANKGRRSVLSRRIATTQSFRLLACAAFFVYLYCQHRFSSFGLLRSSLFRVARADIVLCPQAEELHPDKHHALNNELDALYRTEAFQLDAFEKLGGAVRVPSESYDTMLPVGQDPAWNVFGDLNKYLEAAFPAVFGTLKITYVNTYNLVLHWQGSNTALKPILLTAHQDVVPVEPSTVSDWIHPPYSGVYDGTWIWGRGSCDDKSGLISILVTINALLSTGFQPMRTVVIALGIDEESAGLQGAGKIADYLEEAYGQDGFSMLLDEGSGYVQLGDDTVLAAPDTAEKGYLDVKIEVSTKGGHSSVPPKHTSIGFLSEIITKLEANPHSTHLLRNSTSFAFCQCIAAHSPSFPPELRELVKQASENDDALEQLRMKLVEFEPVFSAFMGTSQAVDIVSGGVKVNALPEKAYAIVNHRIADDSSVNLLQKRLSHLLLPVATNLNLSLEAFGDLLHTGSAGQIRLSDAFGTALEPAPVTSTNEESRAWNLLSGTIRATLLTSFRDNFTRVAVSPSLAIGNTDTKSYWNLTKNIFRYGHGGPNDAYNGAHTVNEALRGDGMIEQIRFLTKLILNADETAEL